MEYIALAIAPGLAICLFIFHRDAYNKEPKLTLISSFLLGAVSIIPAFYIERDLFSKFGNSLTDQALKAFFLVALTEELCKFLVLRLYSWRKKSFDEPFDGIVYAVIVSMGFATVENLLYVIRASQVGMGYQVALLRMFLSVPAHATFGVLMGYHVGRAKFNPQRKSVLIILGLFWAVLFHGTYDTFLFWQGAPQLKPYLSDIFLFAGAVISFIVALRLSWKLIGKHRQLSQRTFMPGAALTLRRAYEKDIPLIRELTMKVWPQTYSTILTPEQIEYMLKLMYSEQSLSTQMKEQQEFIIVDDGKEPVGFASFSLSSPGVYKLHKIYILPSIQGKGAGKFVINEITKAILRKGGTTLQLNVNRNNKAKDFYERAGFTVIKEEDIDIGNGYFMNDYVMEKKINPLSL
ncbi:MAG TPA: GNAT family N-acetyltransferase [Chitinophagaceae bacterium]|nr:GNAT family N-acetyltransferase [Chitinophagaceae bacterium]